MKAFVTGATGYIGGSIAEKLVASGHEVRGLVRSTEKEKEKIPLLKARGINLVVGTLDTPEILTSAAQAADAVIHAARADPPGSVVTVSGAKAARKLGQSLKRRAQKLGGSAVGQLAELQRTNAALRDEIARFKGGPAAAEYQAERHGKGDGTQAE
jgi:uncharacterized protein YbjT (DUF2867 family)